MTDGTPLREELELLHPAAKASETTITALLDVRAHLVERDEAEHSAQGREGQSS